MARKVDFYAVLVGASRYRAYALSMGSDPTAYDLQGPPNDVALWSALLERMGVPVENRRVLGSATRGPDATKEAIERELDWLIGALRSGPQARGLFLWSGHGATGAAGELLLCPEDVTSGPGGVQGALAHPELDREWGRGGDLDLTVVLDTCHAGSTSGPRPTDRLRSLTPGVGPAAGMRVGDSVPTVSACLPEQSSYELEAGDRVFGALSFAAVTVLRRWGFAGPHEPYAPIEYQDLLARSRALLAALSFDQTPYFSGPIDERDLAVFDYRDGDRGTVEPQDDGGRELDPDVYDLIDPAGTENLGRLHVTDENGGPPGFAPDHAYWYYTSDPFARQDGFALRLSASSVPGFRPGQTVFSHDNRVFSSDDPGVTDDMDVWYDWTRVTGTGTETMGWLGTQKSGSGYKLLWVTEEVSEGTLAKLQGTERFVFTRRSTDPTLPAEANYALDEPV